MSASKSFSIFFAVVAILATFVTLNVCAQTPPAYGSTETYDSPSSTRAQPPTPPLPTDVCPNIPGDQATVPADRIKNAAGDCVVPPTAFGAWFEKYWWILPILVIIGIVGGFIISWMSRADGRVIRPTPRPTPPAPHTPPPTPLTPPATPGAPAPPVTTTTTTTTATARPSPLPAHLRPPAAPATPAAPAATPVPGPTGPAVPPATPIIAILVLAGSLFAGRGMAAQCDNVSLVSFYPAIGAVGQSSRSVVKGNFQNVTSVVIGSRSGSGVSTSFVATSPNEGMVNWSVASNATLTAKQVTLVCGDGSFHYLNTFFRVAATTADVERADQAWGAIPPQIQQLMNQPPAPTGPAPRIITTGGNTGHDPYAVAALQALEGFAKSFSGDAVARSLYLEMINHQISPEEFGRRVAMVVKNDTQSQVNTAVSGLRSDIGAAQAALNGMNAKIAALSTAPAASPANNTLLTKRVDELAGQVKSVGDRVDRVDSQLNQPETGLVAGFRQLGEAEQATAEFVLMGGKTVKVDGQKQTQRDRRCEVARLNKINGVKGCRDN